MFVNGALDFKESSVMIWFLWPAVKYSLMNRSIGLWCALNNGITRVASPSAITIFDNRRGLPGTAQGQANDDDITFVVIKVH